jgi:hypothetical protein
MSPTETVEWLFTHSGPILRYRTATDLMDPSPRERAKLLRESLASPQVQRWLRNLRQARAIHGSKDTNAENALAKLLDYGLDGTVPVFAQSIKNLLDRPLQMWDSFVLPPFLLRAGYTDHPAVDQWLKTRLEILYQTTQLGSFDFYLSSKQAAKVPGAWRGKPIYSDEFGHQAGYPLPTCYDFYALAYCPLSLNTGNFSLKREAVVAFLSNPRFQSTVGGYGWDRDRKRCYAAGRVFLACAVPTRLVLFLELGARVKSACRSIWFQQGLASLEAFKTPQATYRFPPELMTEKASNHLYGGSHMGLGENRRTPQALELESTFRMLSIQKSLQNQTPSAIPIPPPS